MEKDVEGRIERRNGFSGGAGEAYDLPLPATDGAEGEGERAPTGAEPDVHLDVPSVTVDEIHLEVEDLRARVQLRAEVLDLLHLDVGADVALGKVQLDIKGVEAQAMLKVRLGNVAAIIERVLETIDRNPQILEQVTRQATSAVRDVGAGAGDAVGELARGAGQAVEETGRGARDTVRDVGGEVGELGDGVQEAGGSATESVAKGADQAAGAAAAPAPSPRKKRSRAPTAKPGTGKSDAARKATGVKPRTASRDRKQLP